MVCGHCYYEAVIRWGDAEAALYASETAILLTLWRQLDQRGWDVVPVTENP